MSAAMMISSRRLSGALSASLKHALKPRVPLRCLKQPQLWVPLAWTAVRGLEQYRRHSALDKSTKTLSPEACSSHTTADALFEALWEAGITTLFVNLGAEHPPLLEAIVRGKRTHPHRFPRLLTCPSEITAISMADGYARVTNRPQAVLVHVDVGTQALAHGVHNASVGRVPVLILAGLAPFTESGELKGSRTEYSHWLQDPPDQKAVVRQYCRYVGEVRTGRNVRKVIGRALQFARSDPKGPTYVAVAREVLAEEVPRENALDQEQWGPIGPAALPADAVHTVAAALVNARNPLIITGYSGRDRRTPALLAELADMIPGIRVHDTGGSDVCFPFSYVASEGFRLPGSDDSSITSDTDVILVLDCDVPWAPTRNRPAEGTKIYQIDCDPLNAHMPVSFFPAHGRWRAESFTALGQLVEHLREDADIRVKLSDPVFEERRVKQARAHEKRLEDIAARPQLGNSEALTADNVGRLLKTCLPDETTFVVEAVTASQQLHDQIQPNRPGRWINCGSTGIGWSNGAVLGVQMALADAEKDHGKAEGISSHFVCQLVGDGSVMAASPSSALWAASKYKIPILTVVLNNGGWKAPRNSAMLVYPKGLAMSASDDEVNLSFEPSPNYAALAEAAAGSVGKGEDSWMKGVRVRTVGELEDALEQAKSRLNDGKGMLIEALM